MVRELLVREDACVAEVGQFLEFVSDGHRLERSDLWYRDAYGLDVALGERVRSLRVPRLLLGRPCTLGCFAD